MGHVSLSSVRVNGPTKLERMYRMPTHDASQDLSRKINRRLTRSGWVYMLGLVVFLFVAIYAFNQLFQLPMKKKTAEIESLNSRLEEMESRLEQVEASLSIEVPAE